jgi:alkylhydroperoxidase family enzyme
MRAVLDGFFQKRGSVPNMFRTAALRPEIGVATANLMAAVLNTGTVDLRLKEMLIVRTSKINGCVY